MIPAVHINRANHVPLLVSKTDAIADQAELDRKRSEYLANEPEGLTSPDVLIYESKFISARSSLRCQYFVEALGCVHPSLHHEFQERSFIVRGIAN
jgi:hypothetical protein